MADKYRRRRSLAATGWCRIIAAALLASLAAGCSGNYAAKEDSAPQGGPKRKQDPDPNNSIFGEGGVTIGSISNIFGDGGGDKKGNLPVNKYLWQAALDTLSFMPLASTDPFTGVIATDWGSTAEVPGERFKVTAYILNPGLSAASLKVAVYREVRNSEGLWVSAPVSARTALGLEDAILTRARQIKIAERDGGLTG